MGYNGVPPRWEEYSKIGKLIPGTPIIPFKVPLRKEICRNLSNSSLSFTLEDLINHCKDINLSMVIDLTQTTRFYNGENLKKFNIEHVKLSTRGGGCMPSDYEVKKFCDTIDKHLKENPGAVVGVHCTHGLNRTGYFICRYMIDRLGFMGSKSVDLFEECRGHTFDRENYRDFLMKRNPNKNILNSSNKNDFKDYNESHNFNRRFNDGQILKNKSTLYPTCSAFESNKHEILHSRDKPCQSKSSPYKISKNCKFDSDKQQIPHNKHKNLSRYSNDETNYADYRSYKASIKRNCEYQEPSEKKRCLDESNFFKRNI